MSDPHTSQARLARAADPSETVGCGLLVTPRHVVTCAHVVAETLDQSAQLIPVRTLFAACPELDRD